MAPGDIISIDCCRFWSSKRHRRDLAGRQHARGGGSGAPAQHMQSPPTPTAAQAARQQSPGAGGTFRVTLSMKKEPDGGPVFCKMEQTQRFKQLKTVKLHTDTVYRIDVSFKPPRALQSLVIQGQEMEPCERARDSTACAYSSYYNTEGLSPSKKGTREDLTIIMKVDGSGELSTCLQIKLYKAHDIQHCEWGSRLHCIELDCTSTEGPEGVRVNRETYRQVSTDSSTCLRKLGLDS
ncbi:CB1 cannabinoid receptor-interacting protein 1-like [Schistocerca nitens]|uniref:CB1 cannabinoid receptor-interacting protein 1-like n=2 Tax=Schistocerca TaxID=7008 RepID=UPI0021192D1E|nr:CB1 cannabinoid receptor-interacting protein 1-like [Schistocerca nitens]